MVLFLEKLFSLETNWYVDDKYDLDLSYITPRVIAMAQPGDGFNSLYKNPAETVSQFIKEKHKGNFLIVNLGNHCYNKKLFDDKVIEIDWVDHKPASQIPLTQLVFNVIKKMLENPQLVIAVHCWAGKGRTGTFISCLLIMLQYVSDIQEAQKFYLQKRFVTVEREFQLKNIQYFKGFYDYLLQDAVLDLKAVCGLKIETNLQLESLKVVVLDVSSTRTLAEMSYQVGNMQKSEIFLNGIFEFDTHDYIVEFYEYKYFRHRKLYHLFINNLLEKQDKIKVDWFLIKKHNKLIGNYMQIDLIYKQTQRDYNPLETLRQQGKTLLDRILREKNQSQFL